MLLYIISHITGLWPSYVDLAYRFCRIEQHLQLHVGCFEWGSLSPLVSDEAAIDTDSELLFSRHILMLNNGCPAFGQCKTLTLCVFSEIHLALKLSGSFLKSLPNSIHVWELSNSVCCFVFRYFGSDCSYLWGFQD